MDNQKEIHKQNNLEKNKKKKPKEDILEIVKQFITYFEEADRSEKDDYSI